jgi:hypothetical protein
LIFAAGDSGSWDDEGYISLAFANLDKQQNMYYVGFGDWKQETGYQITQHQFLGHATWDGSEWVRDPEPLPLNNTDKGEVSAVAAVTVASRVHLWITDTYDLDDGSKGGAVGYFLYDPDRKNQ